MDAASRLVFWRGTRSRVAVARILDCDPSYLHLLEHRERRPGEKFRERLELATGIPALLWDNVVIASKPLRRAKSRVNDLSNVQRQKRTRARVEAVLAHKNKPVRRRAAGRGSG